MRLACRRYLFRCHDTDGVLCLDFDQLLNIVGLRYDVGIHKQKLFAAGFRDADIATVTESAISRIGDESGPGKARRKVLEVAGIRFVVNNNHFPVLGKLVGQGIQRGFKVSEGAVINGYDRELHA